MYDLVLNEELRSAQFRSYMYMYFQRDILSQWLKKVGNWVLVSLTPYILPRWSVAMSFPPATLMRASAEIVSGSWHEK